MILRPAENRRNAPLWLNWKPITVDFSPWRENQMVMAKMAADAVERSNAARQKAADLDVPKFEGLHHDVAWAYDDAITAKRNLENVLMQGNPQAIMKTPEFAKAYRDYAQAVSPARAELLKEQKKSHDEFGARLEKIGEESAGLFYMDKNGLPINSPDGGLWNAAELHMLRRDYEGFSVNNEGQNINFRTGVLGSVKEFQKHLGERFGQAGVTKEKFDNAKALQDLIKDAESQPDAALLATIKQSVERGGNASQLMAAAKASLKTMGPEQTGAIINAYARTNDFQERSKLDASEGGFRVNGAISPELVYKAAFTDAKHSTSLKMGDKQQKVDFATGFVVDEAARFLSESNLISSDLVSLKGRKPTVGGTGDSAGLVNVMAWWQNVGAGMKYNPYTGAKEPIGRKQPLTIVHDVRDQYGNVVGKDAREIDSYTEKLPRNAITEIEKEAGIVDKDGNRKSVDELPEVSAVFPDTEFRMANGGKTYSTADIPEGLKVKAIYPQVTMIPDDLEFIQNQMSYGETEWPSNRPGGMSPYWVVELETTSKMGQQLTDYVKGLDGIQEIGIDSEQYKGSYPKGVKEGSEGFNLVGPSGRIVKVLVKASVGDMQRRGVFQINPDELRAISDQAIESRAASSNYEASIRKAMGLPPDSSASVIESRPGDLNGPVPYRPPSYIRGPGENQVGGGMR